MRKTTQAVVQPQGSKRKSAPATTAAPTTAEKSRSIRFYLTKNCTNKNTALILEFFPGTSGRVQTRVNYKENVEPPPKKTLTVNSNTSDDNSIDDNHIEENPLDKNNEASMELANASAPAPSAQQVPLLARGQRPKMVIRF